MYVLYLPHIQTTFTYQTTLTSPNILNIGHFSAISILLFFWATIQPNFYLDNGFKFTEIILNIYPLPHFA